MRQQKAELEKSNQPRNHYVIVRTDRSRCGDGDLQYIEIRDSKGRNGIFLPKAPLSPQTVRKWNEHNREHRELEIDEDHKPIGK